MSHLLQIHADWIVQHVALVGTGIFLGGLLLLLLELLDLGTVENLDLEVVEDGDYVLEFLGLTGDLGKSLVDVLVG